MGTYSPGQTGSYRGVATLFLILNIIYHTIFSILFTIEFNGMRFMYVSIALIIWMGITLILFAFPLFCITLEKSSRLNNLIEWKRIIKSRAMDQEQDLSTPDSTIDECLDFLTYPRFLWNEYSYYFVNAMVLFYGCMMSIFFLAKYGISSDPPGNFDTFALADSIVDDYKLLTTMLMIFSITLMVINVWFSYVYVLRIYQTTRYSNMFLISNPKYFNYKILPIICRDILAKTLDWDSKVQ